MNPIEKFFAEPFNYEDYDTSLEKVFEDSKKVSILNYIKNLFKKKNDR